MPKPKLTAVETQTDYAKTLECELAGALYVIQGVLAGAMALSEQGIEREQGGPDSTLFFNIQHCVRGALYHLEALNERIEIAVPKVRKGEPIGESQLLRSP